MKHVVPLLLLGALCGPLAACNEGEASSRTANPTQAAASDPRHETARMAAEIVLRTRLRHAELRGVQVFSQALPDTMVVCGRARNAREDAYAPYVGVINFEGGTPRVASFQYGSTGAEASRVFLEMVDRCFDGGGPATSRATARATPPLPSNPVAETPAAAPVAQSEPAPTAPARMATARSNANIRNMPGGGDVLRTLPAGARMEVLAQAPGNWFQLGQNGAVVGWAHGSLLELSATPLQVAEGR